MRQRLAATAAAFAKTSVSFFAVLVLVRAFEFLLVRNAHVLPPGSGLLALRGLRSDAALTLWLAALLAIPILLLGQWSERAARATHRTCLVVLALVAVLLAQYFAVTFVPLGADLFGYSWQDTKDTVMAAGSNVALAVIVLVVFAAVTWYLTGHASKLKMPKAAVVAFFATVLASIVFHSALALKPPAFGSDAAYYLAENKLVYFAGRTASFVAANHSTPTATISLSGYPLFHSVSYDDVLGPFLKVSPRKPNLVFILVEGLGRDFAGDGAYYGGFMPFVDSLSRVSLYWENALSTTGRSFGAIPSILGSLPFASEGFMELGARIPRNASLIDLLKARGYSTSYYSGSDGHFDNIDVFLETEGIDHLVDQSKFGAGYVKQPAGSTGFTWGYPDGELFRRGLELTGAQADQPRLDFYATLTSHEPFIPPDKDAYLATFEQRLSRLPLSADRRDDYRKYSAIFSTLLYTDNSIREFIGAYSKRTDFANTIFIITGDHRLIPIPERARLDRYHVPVIIYSPMLKAGVRFSSVSSHLDIVPSVLGLLKHSYGMSFPDFASWLGSGLDTARAFRNVHSLGLMRTKNQLDDYLDRDTFLSAGETFRLDSGFLLRHVDDSRLRRALEAKLNRFRAINTFVTTGEHLYPGAVRDTAQERLAATEDSLFLELGLDKKTPTAAFQVAQQLAWKGEYAQAQAITLRLLRDTPNFHDARALLGRTYAWQHNYSLARETLTDLVRRAPEYVDGNVALIDEEIWAGNGKQALAAANAALARSPDTPELLLGKARALESLGLKREALAELDALKAVDPNNAAAALIRAHLTR